MTDMDTILAIEERQRRFQLAQVLQLTDQMLGFAKDGEWDKLEQMEALRSVEMSKCADWQFETDRDLVAEALATLLQLNENIIEVVRYAQNKIVDDQVQLQRKTTATKAYIEHE
jgi:hypothetical protein